MNLKIKNFILMKKKIMSKKLNIGLDIDNTMFKLNVMDLLSTNKGAQYDSEQIYNWDLSDSWISPELKKEIKSWFKDDKIMSSLEILDGTKEKLEQWKKEGKSLYSVTARSLRIKDSTIDMLENNFGKDMFSGIAFSSKHTKDKPYYWGYYDINVWIDDNPHDVKTALELGIPTVYGISNEHTSYNEVEFDLLKEKYSNFRIVSSIKEIDL